MKLSKIAAIITILLVGFSTVAVNAENVRFSIYTENAKYKSSAVPSCNNNNSYSAVNWQTSRVKDNNDNYYVPYPHNMWFQVTNVSGRDKGTVLVSYLATKVFRTSLSYGEYGVLKARRENSCDPATRVTGVWNA